MNQDPSTTPSQAYQALENLRMRLLDLTARNRLINFRHTRGGSLRVIDELPNQLVARLLSETEMHFAAVAEPKEQELIAAGYLKMDEETGEIIRLRNDPNAEEWARELGFTTRYEVPDSPAGEGESKHADNAIQTLLYPYEMEANLKRLLQAADSAIEEMGANILYLAFGFLEWYENPSSDNARIAPLFLVPVRLRKGRLNAATRIYHYTLSYSGEEIIPNLSLREKLRADFAMALPELDENTVPEEYFQAVRELIAQQQPRWRVRRYISLALLNFSKLLMYLDLDPARWPEGAKIVEHPVISRFLSGEEGREPPEARAIGFGADYSIDELAEIHTKYPLIDDADSSQHSALVDAVEGKNLVIEGPPGTGKSQTITNLIAAAMAQGKKVLFVAEKLAALEVVRSRLDAVQLGEFCLELHSHKSQKRRVLEELGERLRKHGHYAPPDKLAIEIAGYEENKEILKRYAERINQPWKNTEKTLHQIFMGATRYRTLLALNPERLHPEGYDGSNYTPSVQRRNEDQVERYRKVYQALTEQLGSEAALQDHPWYGIDNDALQLFDLERVQARLGAWQGTLQLLLKERLALAERLGCEPTAVALGVSDAQQLWAELESIASLQGDELLESLPLLRGATREESQRYLALFEEIQTRYATLAETLGAEALPDVAQVEELLQANQQLKALVAPEVTLSALATARNRLQAMQEQLDQLDEPRRGVVSALGEAAAPHLTLSESGLTEFKRVIERIADLNPAYWRDRDPRFDNEELDQLLPQLRTELTQLQALRKPLQGTFALERVPSEESLRQLSTTLAAGGLFRWFTQEWRSARKELLSYAANPQVPPATLLAAVDELASFVGKQTKLEQNRAYRAALGPHLRGLESDLSALEALRHWYRQVRREYGIGFGRKVALGDAILELPANTAQAVRSLVERGILQQLGDLLNELASLQTLFAPVAELRAGERQLSGDQGTLAQLRSSVDAALQKCGPLAKQNTLSIAELGDRIEQLALLKSRVERWQAVDLDHQLFQGRLRLQPGLHHDNRAALSILRNTLELAAKVEGELRTQALQEYLYHRPSQESFAALADHAKALDSALAAERSARAAYRTLVHLEPAAWMIHSGDRLEALLARNQRALQSGETLPNWLNYVRERKQLHALGMARLTTAVEQLELTIEQVETAYQAGIFDLLAREILHQEPELARFSGHTHQAIQQQFQAYDNQLKKLQCQQIAWRIDQTEIPQGNRAARVRERTERVLLEHECAKKSRHLPIRQLLQRAGKALVALKPCFMMGPMSVSHYLAPGEIYFDLVVMDEASQIKPQDALGAVARGGQLVVVGDPKQLPPTSFFDRMVDDDEEDPTAIEESESILDAALPMFTARRLRWHYRSQHESLIAFSNHSFYDSDLVLFPSPYKQTDNYGIQYIRVPHGCFVNRKNLEEAKVIAEAVREHFRQRPEETLGVVAMSAEQREHIERALESLAKEDPLLQESLDRDTTRRESLFIKNLENVQGDERDVIYISLTYGPPAPGARVYQRFGPINSDVGWRRLNVLFTRSKKRMHIFSSMGSEDVIAGPTSKRGVQALHDFLRYCESGILHRTERDSGRGPASDFAIAVMSALRDEGFSSIPQVGVAGFFIDVAVIDPGNPGRYLMGIEGDGATYHAAKSVRDRDRLRQTVLERLGWRIRRIWSTDWFTNPHGELQPILEELHALSTDRPDSVPEGASKVEEIHKIVHEVEVEQVQSERFVQKPGSLRDQLTQFDQEILRKEQPNTPQNRQLLRPAMVEALLALTPTSQAEFLEMIPSYLREATEAVEMDYLERVFAIINAGLERD